MKWVRIFPVIGIYTILATSAAQAQNAPTGPSPASLSPIRPAISRAVLVGAHWCAPCRTELPDLGLLASAAAPAHIALGWTDRMPVLAADLAGAIEVLPVRAAQDLVAEHGTAARGLPFALAYGVDGKICTIWRGPLRPADWPKLERACQAG